MRTEADMRAYVSALREYFEVDGEGEIKPSNQAATANPSVHAIYKHAMGSCTEILTLLDEGRALDAHRLLGIVQGALWASGLFTLVELRNVENIKVRIASSVTRADKVRPFRQ